MLTRDLDAAYGIDSVVGHRDVNDTACPGDNAMQDVDMFNRIAQEL